MYDPEHLGLDRRKESLSPKVRHLIYLLSALLFATAVIGWLDAEAQMWGYTLPNGAGGENYYLNRADTQMMQLGTQALWMGHQAQAQRRQLNAEYGWVEPRKPRVRLRKTVPPTLERY